MAPASCLRERNGREGGREGWREGGREEGEGEGVQVCIAGLCVFYNHPIGILSLQSSKHTLRRALQYQHVYNTVDLSRAQEGESSPSVETSCYPFVQTAVDENSSVPSILQHPTQEARERERVTWGCAGAFRACLASGRIAVGVQD